jgi:hypothetical protein
MYLCYVDESGTSEIPGNSAYFVLAGIAIPIWHWKDADREINRKKTAYGLQDAEIHTAWMLRYYKEQQKVADFNDLDRAERRRRVEALRRAELLRLQNSGNPKHYRQTRKSYRATDGYIHLTHEERKRFVTEVANMVGGWGYARLFAECVDKVNFSVADPAITPVRQAFEQVVSRFELYLAATGGTQNNRYGLIIHDNNDTVAKKHTELMKKFHREGTFFTRIKSIIDTPLFVDSALTSMVQIADLCSYALRRYFEKGEEELFDAIFQRADRRGEAVVGVRHFTPQGCTCKVCAARGRDGAE